MSPSHVHWASPWLWRTGVQQPSRRGSESQRRGGGADVLLEREMAHRGLSWLGVPMPTQSFSPRDLILRKLLLHQEGN